MEIGRELDALVAEKIMGWHNNKDNPKEHGMWGINDWRKDGTPVLMPDFPCFSEHISDAWEVVNEIKCHSFELYWEEEVGWKCEFEFWDDNLSWIFYSANGDTAPHAICLAALKVVESKSKPG